MQKFFFVALILAASTFLLVKIATPSSPQVLSETTAKPLPVSANDIQRGNKEAKIVLVEYADFQCPACAYYHSFTKQVLAGFDEKILFVYRFFPLKQIHKNAFSSSQAAYAAELQGKFWEMQDLLYENQKAWSEAENAQDIFLSYAKKLDLDLEKYKKDFDNQATKNFINEQQDGGINMGVNSTPTFFVNGKQIMQNPRTYEEFKQIIEKELK